MFDTDEIENELIIRGITGILFDDQRHLIAEPYNASNCHAAAQTLGIKRCWWHRNHYDVPKRMIQTLIDYANECQTQGIEGQFIQRVSPRVILAKIKRRIT